MENAFRVKVDALGRVTIPIEIRRLLGINTLEHVNVLCNGKSLTIFKNETNLDRKIRELLGAVEGTNKITNVEHDTLCEILDKLRS